MIDAVPLKEDDKVEEIAGIEVLFDTPSSEFKERGYTQYFYLQQDAELPIRDVKNTHGKNNKTEPFIERKAENLCSECYQSKIDTFTRKHDRRYLFLVTNTRNSILEEEYGRQKWIVGYIEKQRGVSIDGRTAVQGPTKLVSFDDAVSVKEIDADTGFRSNKKLDAEQTQKIIRRFSNVENIYERCLERVRELEEEIGRGNPWEPPGSLVEGIQDEQEQKPSSRNRGC